MTASTKWRLYFTGGAANTAVREVQMREVAGTPQLFSGGTASASSSLNGNSLPVKATDDNAGGTLSYWQANTAVPVWWQYDFASPVQIVEYTIQTETVSRPTDWQLQYWDGSAFVAADTRSGITWAAGVQETKTFTVGSGVTLQNSQTAVEVLRLPTAANLRLDSAVVEVLRSNGTETSTPTLQRITGMDYVFGGQPFTQLAKYGIDTNTLDVASGGQPFVATSNLPSTFATYSDSITEAASATVAQDASVVSGSSAVSEAATAADSQSSTAAQVASITEAASATATQSAYIGTVSDESEAATATDSSAATVAGAASSMTESANATDLVSATMVSNVSATEAATAGEQAGGGTQNTVTEAANAVATNNAANQTSANMAEAGFATSTSAASLTANGAITEAANATDNTNAVSGALILHTEAAHAVDASSATVTYVVAQLAPATALDASGRSVQTFVDIEEDGTNAEDSSATLLGIGRMNEAAHAQDFCDCGIIYGAAVVEVANATDSMDRYQKRAPHPSHTWEVPASDRVLLLPKSNRILELESNRDVDIT